MTRKILTVVVTGLLCQLLACSTTPRFINPDPIKLDFGKANQQTISVKHINKNDMLYPAPGGPHISSTFDFTNTPRAIVLLKEKKDIAVIATNAAELLFISMENSTGRLVAEISLQKPAIALFAHKQILYVGYENSGLETFDLANLPRVKALAYNESLQNISRILTNNGKVFALQDNNTILRLDETTVRQPRGTIKTSAAFKAGSPINDFAILDNRIYVTGPELGVAEFLADHPDEPAWSYTLQETGKQLTVSDGYLYLASGKAGLSIFELRSDQTPRWSGSHNKFDSIVQVLVNSRHAVVVDNNTRLATLNIDNKSLPITGSFYRPQKQIFAAALDETFAYIATVNRLEKIAFPQRSHAQISNEGVNQGGTRRAFISNDIAYVADWFSGLHLYDISNPGRPVHLSNYHTPGSSKGVVVENGVAYVGDDDHGLQIIDVSDPARPVKISEIMTTGLAYTLKKHRDTLYLADHRGGLHIIDVADKHNPAILGSYDTPGKSWAIAIKDHYAFVADDNSGVLILDVSNPNAIKQVGQFNPGGFAEDIFIRGNHAYVSFFDKGLYILDITHPREPVQLSQLAIPGNARSVTVVKNLAYIAGWESGLQIVDVSNVNTPAIIGHYDTKGSAWGVDVYKQHAYVWDWWGGVKVIDVSQPRNPKLAGKYHTRGTIQSIRNRENYLYTANGKGGVQVFDIKNALNPIWVTGFDTEKPVSDIYLSSKGDRAFVATNSPEVQVLDISDPFYIYALQRLDIGGKITQLRERNNILATIDSEQGLKLYDIRDLGNIKLNGRVTVKVNDIDFASDRKLYLASNTGFYELLLDDSGSIKGQRFYEVPDQVNRITASADTVVTVTDRFTFHVWQKKRNRLTPVASSSVSGNVIGLSMEQHQLFLVTQKDGLLVYDMRQPSDTRLISRYPATDTLGNIVVKNNFVFFAGSNTIASVELMPRIAVEYDENDIITLHFPANLPLGNYHLELSHTDQSRLLWPNAVNVERPKSGKSQISMEKFKELLEQQRALQNQPPQNNPQE